MEAAFSSTLHTFIFAIAIFTTGQIMRILDALEFTLCYYNALFCCRDKFYKSFKNEF